MDWNNLFATWYMWLSSLNSALAEPVRDLSNGLGVPFVSAFLFGLLGTTAPCQLSTNFGALAFLTRKPSERAATMRATFAYIGAKMLVYTVLGLVVLTMGRQLFGAVGPYVDWARKIIGPLMILLGLAVLGVVRVRLQFGQRLARELERKAATSMGTGERIPLNLRPMPPQQTLAPFTATALAGAGASAISPGVSGSGSLDPRPALASSAPTVWSSFLLGLSFSLAFCPTLLLLFLSTMALAARSTAGFTFSTFFALGTALPLALFVGLILTSAKRAERFRRGMRRANRPLRWLGGVVLILLGLHDTLIYWFL